jgi:hypothetical protein
MTYYYCLFNNRKWTLLEFNNWKNPHICWCQLLFFSNKEKELLYTRAQVIRVVWSLIRFGG